MSRCAVRSRTDRLARGTLERCRFGVAVLLVVCACACGGSEAEPDSASGSALGSAPKPTSFHTWFHDTLARAERGDGSWEAVSAGSVESLPIVRIEMKRLTVGYDFWSLELELEPVRARRLGGTSEWPAESEGPLVAEVPFHEYARLCWLIESLDLPRQSAEWSVPVTHQEKVDIACTTRDGRTVALSDYGSAGPPALAALAAAIQDTARGLSWGPER